jgi:hypothetical protein
MGMCLCSCFKVHGIDSAYFETCTLLTDEAASSGNLFVRNYHYLLLNNPVERSSRLLRGGSLKSRKVLLFSAAYFRAFAKLWKATNRFLQAVRLHGKILLPLDGFWRNLIFEDFSKISRENPSFVKIWQEKKGNITWRHTNIYDNISLNYSKNEKCFRQKF